VSRDQVAAVLREGAKFGLTTTCTFSAPTAIRSEIDEHLVDTRSDEWRAFDTLRRLRARGEQEPYEPYLCGKEGAKIDASYWTPAPNRPVTFCRKCLEIALRRIHRRASGNETD
jgi:hypothetical protein